MIAVVLLARILQRGGNPVALGGVVIDQIGDPKDSALRCFDELKSRHRVGTLPLAQFLDDVLDFPDFVLRALAGIDAGDVARSRLPS